MRGLLTWGRLLAAILATGTVALALGRLPTRAVTTACISPTQDGTLLVTGHAPGASGAILFAADPARTSTTPRALVRALPAGTAIGPSPRGRYIALAEGARGLWLVNSDGTGPRRLLPAPPPAPGPTGTRYIDAVAWSPDRYTLAYAVGQPLGYPRYPAPPRAAPDGIWLVRYDGGTPRLLVSNARLGVDGVNRLSFSADGRTLAAAADQGRSADNLAVDASTGRSTPLPGAVATADDVQISPAAPRLAYQAVVYIPVPGQPNTEDAEDGVFVSDARGRRQTLLVRTSSTSIQDPVWSPDGRSVAYLWGGPSSRGIVDEVHAVDVATGRVRTLVEMASRQQFMDLAWMHCQS